MPMEMRAFIEKGDVLLERYEKGVDTRTNIVRALKVAHLFRCKSKSWQTVSEWSVITHQQATSKATQYFAGMFRHSVKKAILMSQARLSKSMGGIQEWQKEKAQWEKEKAEYEV
jgi:hypothetical protein